MYHVGRPGEDGFTERVLAAWGVDGHNSHTNICSSGGRVGYAFWMGYDRPSPDYANARVILLISAHLESGHYFNPHAQRIIEGKRRGARLIVIDPRLSNTASQADHWLPAWPGSEPALLLAIARELIVSDRFDRDFVRRWVNWEEYLRAERPDLPPTFESFVDELKRLYDGYTLEYAEAETGIPAEQIRVVADEIARAGGALAAHNWRASSAGVIGGWLTARCLFFLNVLTGSVGTPGGTSPNAWDKWVPRPPYLPPHPKQWNELTWPREYPLAFFEMSFLLPALPARGSGRAGCLLHPGLQPGLDEPRRDDLGGGAHPRGPRRPARRADAGLERDGLVRRLRPAGRASAASDTTSTATRPTPAAGSASASRSRGSPPNGTAGRSPTPARRTRARSGRRTSSGSSCRGGSIPTVRSASGAGSRRRTGRARR